MTRRGLLRIGLRAVAGAAGATALAGCARHRPPAAAPPTAQAPVLQLRFMPWWNRWTGSGPALLRQACARFEAANPGLRLQALPGPNGAQVASSSVLAAMLSGTGPDVVCDYGDSFAAYVAAGAFTDLGPLLRADGIPTTEWSAAHMAALRTTAGQFGLPTYDGPCVYAYRRDLLEASGVAVPDPGWTFVEAVDAWRRCARPSGGGAPARLGATVWWWDGWKASNWLFSGFGGAEMDPAGTTATLTDPRSLQAGEWLLPLLWSGVAGIFTAGTLQDGTTAFALRGGWSIQADLLAYGTRFAWDYLPAPVFPAGRATFGNNDFWGLNAFGRQPEAAWVLLKWLAHGYEWQRFCMRTLLLQPCSNALWEEWEATMRAAAPILRGKALRWYRDAAQGGYGYAQRFFRYQPLAADAVLAEGISALNAAPTEVAASFSAMNERIDALERAGEGLQGRLRPLPPGVAATALLPPPHRSGLGRSPAPAGDLVGPGPQGSYRLQGPGAGLGGAHDAATLAAAAENRGVGEYVCRIAALSGTSRQAQAGLMARGDLSDDAPMAAVWLTAAGGVRAAFRLMAGYPASAAPAAAPGPAPLWVRLRREGQVWTAWTSADGVRWLPVGAPMPVLMGGAWVGIFAAAGSAGAGPARAAFDRLDFTPGAFYRLGGL